MQPNDASPSQPLFAEHTDSAPDDAEAPAQDSRRSGAADDHRFAQDAPDSAQHEPRKRPAVTVRTLAWILPVLLLFALIAYVVARTKIHTAMRDALPQLDGTIQVPGPAAPFFGLHAPVIVTRDAHGVPHIRASSVDDLVYAQGYVTAQDRLWQMELLRRHAAGELAAILGASLLEHDRLQRTLQLRTAADRAFAVLPADQKHFLEVYARGVNLYINTHRDRLPLEFHVLQFTPGAWSPRDSLLVAIAMYQDLSNFFPSKLGRESLAAHLPPELMADLYPTGSWRDHWPGQRPTDLTTVQPDFHEVPLDKSQTRLHTPTAPDTPPVTTADTLLALNRTLSLFHNPCAQCVAGSNAWAVAGARTASGKPLLSNDIHFALTVPGLWYEADLEASGAAPMAPFHAAGLTLPGTPFVIAGHNEHIAWGFTNLGADVQDLYIEHTRGTPSGAEYQTEGGSWKPVRYRREIIHVRNGSDVTLDVPLTQHGDAETPVISSIFPGETRSLSLRWTIYDPANISDPFYAVDAAPDWTSILSAFSGFGGPAENMIYADDQGHIGFHAVGRIPIRGDDSHPSPLSPVPTDTQAPDAAAHEWSGYVPFDQLPQAFDPADGVVSTANSRVTPDNYTFPITLDWMAPYRNERVYKLLENTPGKPTEARHGLTPADMLAIQTDVFSELDQIVAQKLVYAIDHTGGPLKNDKTLHQAADILRKWDGQVAAGAAAPAIVNAARNALWPLLLVPHLTPQLAPAMLKGTELPKNLPPDEARTASLYHVYVWGERPAVEEQLLTHQPDRWLPGGYANWNDFLAAVVHMGLRDAHAPQDLAKWSQGQAFPLVLEHPIFSGSALLKHLIPQPTAPGSIAVSGDSTTILQIQGALAPSERMTVDLGNPDLTTLNIVLGESGNLSSPWYMDQFPAWLHGTTFPLPFTSGASQPTTVHMLTLAPR